MRRYNRFIYFFLIPFLVLTGCNETFEPWEDNDRYHFSIYGYLDATADTQWVRVMPVREELLLKPEPIDATVTLEHIEGEESVVMKDSLFRFAGDRYAYNFWTTMDLQPGERYRLTAERSDGLTSSATVTLPEDFPVPPVSIARRSRFDLTPIGTTVRIQGVDQLADVKTIYRTSDNSEMVTIPHLQDSVRSTSGSLEVSMDPQENFITINNLLPMSQVVTSENFLDTEEIQQHIYIASAGPDHLFFPAIDEKVTALPGGASNIVNGTGYLAGIVSKTIPYKSCFGEGGEADTIIPCEPVSPPWSKIPARDYYLNNINR